MRTGFIHTLPMHITPPIPSAQDLRRTLDALPDPCFILNSQWIITFVNAQATTFVGQPSADLLGHDFWAAVPATRGTPLERETRRAHHEQVTVCYEDYDPLRQRWVEVKVFPVGEGVAVLYHDVTSRKAAEVRSGIVARHSSDLISVHRPGGALTYVSVSPSVELMLGYPEADLIGRSALDLIHPDDQPLRSDAVPHQPDARKFTYRIRRRDGTFIWLETTSTDLRDPSGAVTEILAISRDVTARQHAAALQMTNVQLQAETRALTGFAELARDLAFETDVLALVRRAQAIVLTLLPPGVAFYYEPDGGQWRVRAQTGSVQNDGLQAAIDAGLSFEDTGNLIVPWRTGRPLYQDAYAPDTDHLPDHTEHIGSTATVPIRVAGAPVGVLAVALFGTRQWTDTDKVILDTAAYHLGIALERAQAAGMLEAQRTQLAAANDALEAFSYSVSHDLRTPLRHVQGFISMLRRALKAGDDAKVESSLGIIERASQRMERLIDDLLQFAQVGRHDLRREDIQLQALVDEVREDLTAGGEYTGVHWHVAPLPVIRGDPGLIRQVLSNLLHNAVKYSSTQPQPEVRIRAERTPLRDVIIITDNGVGFDPLYQDRLFGVFQRLHHTGDFEGSGVGLATVRRIVQRHGGEVWATSVPGQGATFSFSVPHTPPERG